MAMARGEPSARLTAGRGNHPKRREPVLAFENIGGCRAALALALRMAGELPLVICDACEAPGRAPLIVHQPEKSAKALARLGGTKSPPPEPPCPYFCSGEAWK